MNEWWIKLQSKQCENLTKEWFSVLGKVDKIPESRTPTYDFKVDDEKLLIEVKWINSENRFTLLSDHLYLGKPLSDEDVYRKMLQKVVSLEKEASNYKEYHRGGVIHYDDLFDFLQYPKTHNKFDAAFPYEYEIVDYDWEYLVLCETPTVGEWPLAFIYVKNHALVRPLEKVFEKHRYTLYILNNKEFVKYRKNS